MTISGSSSFPIKHSMLDVRCSMFDVLFLVPPGQNQLSAYALCLMFPPSTFRIPHSIPFAPCSMPSSLCLLAYPRQLLPRQHIHNPQPPNAGFYNYFTDVIFDHLANHSGIFSVGIRPHRCQDRNGIFRGNKCKQFPFIGQV